MAVGTMRVRPSHAFGLKARRCRAMDAPPAAHRSSSLNAGSMRPSLRAAVEDNSHSGPPFGSGSSSKRAGPSCQNAAACAADPITYQREPSQSAPPFSDYLTRLSEHDDNELHTASEPPVTASKGSTVPSSTESTGAKKDSKLQWFEDWAGRSEAMAKAALENEFEALRACRLLQQEALALRREAETLRAWAEEAAAATDMDARLGAMRKADAAETAADMAMTEYKKSQRELDLVAAHARAAERTFQAATATADGIRKITDIEQPGSTKTKNSNSGVHMESPSDLPETKMAPESSSNNAYESVGEIEGHRISSAESVDSEITPMEKMELDIEQLVNSSIEELISSSTALRCTGDSPHVFYDEAPQTSTSSDQMTPQDVETLTEVEEQERLARELLANREMEIELAKVKLGLAKLEQVVVRSELAAVEYKEMLAQLLQLPPGTPGVKQAVMELQKELLKACKRGERAQKEAQKLLEAAFGEGGILSSGSADAPAM